MLGAHQGCHPDQGRFAGSLSVPGPHRSMSGAQSLLLELTIRAAGQRRCAEQSTHVFPTRLPFLSGYVIEEPVRREERNPEQNGKHKTTTLARLVSLCVRLGGRARPVSGRLEEQGFGLTWAPSARASLVGHGPRRSLPETARPRYI